MHFSFQLVATNLITFVLTLPLDIWFLRRLKQHIRRNIPKLMAKECVTWGMMDVMSPHPWALGWLVISALPMFFGWVMTVVFRRTHELDMYMFGAGAHAVVFMLVCMGWYDEWDETVRLAHERPNDEASALLGRNGLTPVP
ncbi:MAG: hypothetical protein HY092_01115 [Candidatus Kerfeldbacteria bacterium]|nr:hypothetical protein [Candidatus Kerfeldbacteria bacterium]